jgi:hypothetical protein
LAKDVLVPCCVAAKIDIRSTGAEPLNNQPFLRAARVSIDLEVKSNARKDLKFLVDTLMLVDFLEDASALEALAAFLRVRIQASQNIALTSVGAGELGLWELMDALDAFIAGESEGGKVGQALVTAILDLVYLDVRTKAINDPSLSWPADVGAFLDGHQTLGVEVKQRPFTDSEILQFTQRLREAGIYRGTIAALNQGGAPLDEEQLRIEAFRRDGVDLAFYTKASALLREAMRNSNSGLHVSLAVFPRHALMRMQKIEVSSERTSEWAELFALIPEMIAP